MTKSDSSETTTTAPQRLLDGIRSPSDIKALREQDLPQLAQEVRDELIGVLSQTGGHLGPVIFDRAGRKIAPFSVAPWAGEKIDPSTPAILKVLIAHFIRQSLRPLFAVELLGSSLRRRVLQKKRGPMDGGREFD